MEAHQYKSAGLTIAVHVIICLLLFLFYISSPIPPFEEGLAGGGGGGSFVEFGTLDVVEAQPTPAPVPHETKAEEILTSDIEETVVINEPKKKKETPKPVKQKPVVVIPKAEPVKQPVELVKVERRPNESAMMKPKTGNAGSPSGTASGSGTGGEGTGSGGGKGSGTGTGSGGGSGTGSGGGNGDGNGLGFDLGGRSMRVRPRIEENSQEEGRVVINIVVDKDGNVTSATEGGRGSTTTASVLVSKAKQAALGAKFSKSPTGVEEQRGTITFVFKVQ